MKYLLLIVSIVFSGLAVASAQDDIEVSALLEARMVSVQPLENVTESAPQILDLTSDSARLNFVGTIPLACTVLFGESTEFGMASVDANMDGATIIEHNPLMLDLSPDTTYYYRVQGSAEDGTFYIGEVGTFTTEALDETPVANLLSPDRGAEIIGVSSNFGDQDNDGNWGILRALDGNPNTAWSSNGDGNSAWVEIKLAQRSRITQVEFWTRFMSDGSAQIFEFTVSTDSGDTYGPFTLPDPDQPYVFDVDIEAETLRFDVMDSSGGNTGAFEIAVYGEALE